MKCRINKVNGDELSILGFGCMRFPKDEMETEELVLYAIENGINYFDTAFVYKNSEVILGRILSRNNKRKEVKLATKIPPYMVKKYDDLDRIFSQELARLQTDYVDYYFIHMLTDLSVWNRLVDLGIEKWIEEKKAAGQIRNIGFSYHGGRDEFVKICDAYLWEFCMIQYNYLDENNQASRTGLQHAANKGIPVMIMEPLRGGALANNLPKGVAKVFDDAHVKRSPAEWSFRWLWNQPEVTCVLSGMNSLEMLKENIETAKTANIDDFSERDFAVIEKAKQAFTEAIKVPCTGCSYCMPCPQGVDIPTCFSCYNNIVIEGKKAAFIKYIMQTSLKSKPQVASLCNKCGHCEKSCPQKIEIRTELQNTKKAFEKFYFKPVVYIAKKFMKINS
ncbi:MAG: aldo/keto reductase [Nitrososphaerota archaeon]|jgi:predicted aldo/keto reductase-like oxidoreductase|nr:aldo/keto reductase [Nitrososphaerota archaeon]